MPDGRFVVSTARRQKERATISWAHEMLARLAHGGLVAQGANVDVGQLSLATLVAELAATPSNPGGGFGAFGGRGLRLVLGLRAAVGGQVVCAECPVSEEAGPNLHRRRCSVASS